MNTLHKQFSHNLTEPPDGGYFIHDGDDIQSDPSGGSLSLPYELVAYTTSIHIFISDKHEDMYDLLIDGKPIRKSKVYMRLVNYLFHKIYTRHRAKYSHSNGYPFGVKNADIVAKDTNKFNKVKKVLKDNGYLIDDGSWCNGHHSIHYSFGPMIDNATWKLSEDLHTFDTPQYIHNKYHDGIIFSDKKTTIRKVSHNFNLTLDKDLLDKAFPIIAAGRKWSHNVMVDQYHYLTEEFHCFYTVCDTGRIFGGWSSVERDLRGCMMIDGVPAVEVDIKNSQPSLLATFFKDTTSPEYIKFKKIIERGYFYECVMKHLGLDHNDKELRDGIKKEVMSFLNGQFRNRIRSFFDKHFPILLETLLSMKDEYLANKGAGTVQEYSPAHCFKALGWKLQQIESGIIVGTICQKYGNKAYSLHDGVICHPDVAQDIVKDIHKELFAITGIHGRITIEHKRDNLLKKIS